MIKDLVVDPRHRQAGLGTAPLSAALETLADRGAPHVVLSTAARSGATQRLFATAGFRPMMVEM